MTEPELDPPFEVVEPRHLGCGLVLSSPHSGNVYPARFLQCARLDAASLRRSEDAFVDELFLPVVELGVPLLRARFPRAYLDVNREPYELDPRMFEGRLPAFANTRSLRVAGGLGTIPRVVGEAQEIYSHRLPVEEALRRIDELHKTYHAALRGLVDRAARQFGGALLLDCHSMPSAVACGRQGLGAPAWRDERSRADIVIGDRYGTSCHRLYADAACYELERLGYVVERNKPYAGGYITEHFGAPSRNRHALQIEINRSLYMDERTLKPSSGFADLRQNLFTAAQALAALMSDERTRNQAAAE